MTLANRLTACRIFLVPFFIVAVLYYAPGKEYLRWAALVIFLTAAVLDFLDGYVSRKFHQETKTGAILDPLADKVLLISAFLCLFLAGAQFDVVRFPAWLVVAVVSRDLMLILGAMVIRLVHGDIAVKPTRWGKTTVFFEMCAVVGILSQWPYSYFLWYVILILVVISGIDYIIKGIKELNGGLNKS